MRIFTHTDACPEGGITYMGMWPRFLRWLSYTADEHYERIMARSWDRAHNR